MGGLSRSQFLFFAKLRVASEEPVPLYLIMRMSLPV